MKKIVAMMLMVFMVIGLAACTGTAQNDPAGESSITKGSDSSVAGEAVDPGNNVGSEQKTVSTDSEKHVLVVYFSVTGNTKAVAEKIASVTDADIYEIKPIVEYTDADINYHDSGSRTSKEQNDSSARPEIQSEPVTLEGYDTIFIGYPIWWGEEPRIMDTFVEKYDFGDITMIPFCTSGSSGIGNSGKHLAENAGSGNWLSGKRFDTGVSESELQEWIDGL